jgi:hypothetical protein
MHLNGPGTHDRSSHWFTGPIPTTQPSPAGHSRSGVLELATVFSLFIIWLHGPGDRRFSSPSSHPLQLQSAIRFLPTSYRPAHANRTPLHQALLFSFDLVPILIRCLSVLFAFFVFFLNAYQENHSSRE